MNFTGYPIELERRDELEAAASPLLLRAGDFEAPEEVDPRGWLLVEDQGQMGSCQGQALSSACEFAYYIATRGTVIQLSRMFGYLGAQKYDGLSGDRGSTLAGGRRLVTENGICQETVFPYPSRYMPPSRIPETAWEDAKNYIIRRTVICRTYQDVFTFIAGGLGAVQIGITWAGMNPRNGVIESFGGGGGGGHSVVFAGYSRREDREGRKYMLLKNSWGTRWGNRGWAEVAPRAIDAMFRARYTVMQGLTDMETTDKPRSWDFLKNSMFSKHF